MRKNVGTLDAAIRITVGLLGLAAAIGRMSRRPYRTPWMLMFLSAMKVAEGITRFCPMLYSMGLSTRDREGLKLLKQAIGSRRQAGSSSSGQAEKAASTSEQQRPATQTIQSITQEMEQVLTSAANAEQAAVSEKSGTASGNGSHAAESDRHRQASQTAKSEQAKTQQDEAALHPTH